ncbi:MAG TPA: phosphotransferase [Pseudonocardia sp.]|nr:phosphotransferase [Pseudonocardia sp.]
MAVLPIVAPPGSAPAVGLGAAELPQHELLAVARAASGRNTAACCRWDVEPVERIPGPPSTVSLHRVRGVVAEKGEQEPWSVVVKVLQSYRHVQLPPELRAAATVDHSWRHQADLYRAGVADVLPPGMRLPRVYRIDDLGDDRVALWLEDVAVIDTAWDLARFTHAARCLGRLAVRLTRAGHRLPATFSRVPGAVLRWQFIERRLSMLPALDGDRLWAHPLIRAVADERLRSDLRRLASRVPRLLDELDRLPQTFVHGDASPQNLLVADEDPPVLVAIDWTLIGLSAVGYDLAQLLVGAVHAGRLPVEAMPALHEAVLDGYCTGLADEAAPVPEDVVRFGLDATLVVRSAFSALPLAQLEAAPDDGLAALVASRIALTRYLVDVGLSLPTPQESR